MTLGKAIIEAERENNGRLKLLVWRDEISSPETARRISPTRMWMT